MACINGTCDLVIKVFGMNLSKYSTLDYKLHLNGNIVLYSIT